MTLLDYDFTIAVIYMSIAMWYTHKVAVHCKCIAVFYFSRCLHSLTASLYISTAL